MCFTAIGSPTQTDGQLYAQKAVGNRQANSQPASTSLLQQATFLVIGEALSLCCDSSIHKHPLCGNTVIYQSYTSYTNFCSGVAEHSMILQLCVLAERGMVI